MDIFSAGHRDFFLAVVQFLNEEGRSLGKARDGAREVRDFYTLGSNCLWITFADGHLWWAFAEPEVTWLGVAEDGQGARIRKTVDGWRKVNIEGEPLRIDDLSTRLTQVAAYRQTVCRVKASDYLLRRINGIEEPVVARARDARSTMIAVATEMITGLHWADFETLVDLIFARAGWQRISRVGGTQADTDLVLEQPTIGETAFVQVKSRPPRPCSTITSAASAGVKRAIACSSSVTHPRGHYPWTTRPVSIFGLATGSPTRLSRPGCSIGSPRSA